MQTSRTVTKGIYNVETLPNGQKRYNKVGETKTTYTYSTNENDDVITINGKSYRVEYNSEWAYKIMKTKIKAPGAARLLETLTEFQHSCQDYIEEKIIENVKPIK